MPDFFDRVVARDFGLPADAYGVIRVRPRLPQIFERREPAAPEPPEVPHQPRSTISGPTPGLPDRHQTAATVREQRLDVVLAPPLSVPRTEPAPPPTREREQPPAPEHFRQVVEQIVTTPAPLLVAPAVAAAPEVRLPTPEPGRREFSPAPTVVPAVRPPAPNNGWPDPVAAAVTRRRESALPERVVRISIGRVEVKAADVQPPRPSAQQGRPATALSLEGYLATKDGRR